MPIHNMAFDSGLFIARQVGYVDDVDARMWGSALKKHARGADGAIIALIDMREVERLVPTLTKVFSTALALPNLMGIIVVASDQMSSRNARVMGNLCDHSSVRVFSTMDEAMAFARTQLRPIIGPAAGAMAFCAVGV